MKIAIWFFGITCIVEAIIIAFLVMELKDCENRERINNFVDDKQFD
jgi:hypothetical protein